MQRNVLAPLTILELRNNHGVYTATSSVIRTPLAWDSTRGVRPGAFS